jgi:phosphatidylinositol alpha-1,6-mannosyltransferase
MRKTLLITTEFPPQVGGVGNFLFNLTRHFPSDKLVIIAKNNDSSELLGIHKTYRTNFVTTVPFIWPRWLPLFFYVLRIIKKEKIQCLLIGQILPLGTIALLINKVLKIPYFLFTYGLDLTMHSQQSRKGKLVKRIIANSEKILTISKFTKNLLIGLQTKEKKIIFVYPCAAIQPSSITLLDKKLVINEYNPQGKRIILTVGRLVERKGHDQVIKSMPAILKKIPEAVYLIAGLGPRLNYLKNLVVSLGLSNSVRIIERNLDNQAVGNLYNIAELFVMPARELRHGDGTIYDAEGFGIVFLEANLFNLPVIGGRSGGQADAIEDGHSGLLVNPFNIQEISQTIIKLLTDKTLASQLASYGQKRAASQFRWVDQAQKIIELL